MYTLCKKKDFVHFWLFIAVITKIKCDGYFGPDAFWAVQVNALSIDRKKHTCTELNETEWNGTRKKTIEQDVPNKWEQMYDQTKFKPKLKQTAHHAYLLPKMNVSKIYGIQFSK